MGGHKISDKESAALDYIRANIPGLESHLTATRDYALEIKKIHDFSEPDEKIALAALCHDLARLVPPEKIASELIIRDVDPGQFNAVTPILLHGPLSAELAREDLGLNDVEILDAITWHATGRAGMSRLEKIIYVADKIEMTRAWPGIEEIRKEVETDFDIGFKTVLSAVLKYVIAQGWPVDYNSVAAWNEIIGI